MFSFFAFCVCRKIFSRYLSTFLEGWCPPEPAAFRYISQVITTTNRSSIENQECLAAVVSSAVVHCLCKPLRSCWHCPGLRCNSFLHSHRFNRGRCFHLANQSRLEQSWRSQRADVVFNRALHRYQLYLVHANCNNCCGIVFEFRSFGFHSIPLPGSAQRRYRRLQRLLQRRRRHDWFCNRCVVTRRNCIAVRHGSVVFASRA